MITCNACGESKRLDEYRVHKRGYRIGKCRICEAEYQRGHYAKNIQENRKTKREYMARRRAENPQEARAKQRNWREKNLKRQRATARAYFARRFFWSRAMKLRGPNRADYKQLAALWKHQRGRCALSGRRLNRTAQLDHKNPRAKGGKDNIENLQWLTNETNMAKRDLTKAEFFRLCQDVARFGG